MPKKPSGVTVSAGERYKRAAGRLEEAQGQLAAVVARVTSARQRLEQLAAVTASVAGHVQMAMRDEDAAAAAVVDAQAQLLIDEGSDREQSARDALAAAQAAHERTRAALGEAREREARVAARVEEESGQINAQIAGDESAQRDLRRLAASLERQVHQAHKDAGYEELAAAREHHAALTARLDELDQMRAAAQSDLEQHWRDVAALGEQFPEARETREYASISEPEKRRAVGILDAWITFLATLEANAGLGIREFFIEGVYIPQLIAPSAWRSANGWA
jgi:chromosome segregation ATPase